MKLSRIAAAVAISALAPAVLLSSPAFATGEETGAPASPTAPTAPDRPAAVQPPAEQPPAVQTPAGQPDESQAEQDRKTILAIIADPMASEYMKEAGRKAIADGPAAMRKFIETDQHKIRLDDYRILVLRLLNGAGPGLKEGITALLDDHGASLEKLRHFYEVTQHELRDDDNQVDISKLINGAGPNLKEGAKKALKGTPADRVEFLKTGQHHLRDQDNRIEIAQIIDGGGPELIKAGLAALNGTPADRVEFLKTGQHEARAKDKKAQEDRDKEKEKEEEGKQPDPTTPTPTPAPTPTPGSGNTVVTPQGGNSGGPLANTGAGDTGWIAGGAGTALVAGAGLLLAARMRRAGSGS